MIVGTLKDTNIFKGVEDEHLEAIEKFCQTKDLDEEDTIIALSDTDYDIYRVMEGKVGVEVNDSPGQYVAKIGKGGIFGDMAFSRKSKRTSNVVALEKTQVLKIDGPKLDEYLNSNHDVGYQVMKNLMKILCQRLDTTTFMLSMYKD
ncbi:MAG: cyclic nucleotide-binding domain-containing protein [Bacteriovoracaceae bacterium]|nr:cyclic nucleotide-binding domain-containing protein [Bacteriovoracaceae bacterium]